METTDDEIHPRRLLEDFIPLTKGQYPVFNKYPKFIVDYQVSISIIFVFLGLDKICQRQRWDEEMTSL